MTTPAGWPAWTRASGISFFGGSTEKHGHLLRGLVHPDTDISAGGLMRMADHAAALARVAPFALLRVTCNDAAPSAPTINYAALMPSGIYSAGYLGNAPPTGFPSASRNGDGDVDIVFDASYNDAYGVSAAFSVKAHRVTAYYPTAIVAVSLSLAGTQTVTVHLFTASTGAAAPDTAFFLKVW